MGGITGFVAPAAAAGPVGGVIPFGNDDEAMFKLATFVIGVVVCGGRMLEGVEEVEGG